MIRTLSSPLASPLASALADPQIAPGVILDGLYANPDITFTRASSKAYFDKNGVLQTAGTDEWPVEYSI